jgi:hypothetical protein
MNRHEAPGRRAPWLRPGLVVLLGVLAAAASTQLAVPGVRVVALLLFLLLGPGLGLVGVLEIGEPWRETALVIGVSLAVDLVVVTALAYYGTRTAEGTLLILIGIAGLGAVIQVARTVLRRVRRSAAR